MFDACHQASPASGQPAARSGTVSYLLDVNYLVALFDTRHVNHDPAQRWFAMFGTDWATCCGH